MNASELKFGSKVFYHSIPAIVQRVQKNGVIVMYDGQGPKCDQIVTERVSATYLKTRD